MTNAEILNDAKQCLQEALQIACKLEVIGDMSSMKEQIQTALDDVELVSKDVLPLKNEEKRLEKAEKLLRYAITILESIRAIAMYSSLFV